MPPKGSKMSPQHRAAIRAALNHPEVHERRVKAITEAWANPELLAQQSKRMTEQWKNPEYQQLRHTAMLRVAADPKERKRKSKRSKQNWDRLTPEQRAAWVKNLTAAIHARQDAAGDLAKEVEVLRLQLELLKAADARLKEIEKGDRPVPLGADRIVMKKPGPKLDVERAAYICELRDNQRLQWAAIVERVQARFHCRTTIPALKELRKRYRALQKKETN